MIAFNHLKMDQKYDKRDQVCYDLLIAKFMVGNYNLSLIFRLNNEQMNCIVKVWMYVTVHGKKSAVIAVKWLWSLSDYWKLIVLMDIFCSNIMAPYIFKCAHWSLHECVIFVIAIKFNHDHSCLFPADGHIVKKGSTVV